MSANPGKKKKLVLVSTLILLSIGLYYFGLKKIEKRVGSASGQLTLYWFVPDGMRADPDIFQVFEWAKKGELPNIKKMMDSGTWGYSVPVFPGHTPVNMATLFTGSTPMVHGVADGAMRFEGYPLKVVSRSGFSSTAKLKPPIWYTLEEQGVRSTLISVPGSSPPELNDGITVRGRWGGWGLEFVSTIFQSESGLKFIQGMERRVFNFGPELTKFQSAKKPIGWEVNLPQSYSAPQEVELENWGAKIYGYIYDSKNDQKEDYDRIVLSNDKKTILADLAVGGWSEWLPINVLWEVKNDYNIHSPKAMEWERKLSAIKVPTFARFGIIKLGEKGFFRVRTIYDSLNEFSVQPPDYFFTIHKAIGPSVDYVDSYPPQLVYFPEDKKIFLDEANFSLDSHIQISKFFLQKLINPAIIHSIYTPNQMNTSRWWMPKLDPNGSLYAKTPEIERQELLSEVKGVYKKLDSLIGEVLKKADASSVIVLSSDHGALPLNKEIRINNLFAKEGLLKFSINTNTGETEIDWPNTKAIFLQMNNIYIGVDGLGGLYKRGSGEKYLQLRERVKNLVLSVKDEAGKPVVNHILPYEMAEQWKMPQDRVGDLVVANTPGYCLVEDLSNDQKIFKETFKGGYKQGILPDNIPGMLTPFVIMGPGIKRGNELKAPISHIQQYPTIMKVLGKKIPEFVEGKPVDEAFF